MSHSITSFFKKPLLSTIVPKVTLLVFTYSFSATSIKAYEKDYETDIKPLFSKYCLDCHGPKKEKGGFRIDKLKLSLNDHESLENFQNVLDVMAVQDMPPEDEDQPSDAEVLQISSFITKHLKIAKEEHTSGGGRPARRLTKNEYINTIQDLLGVYIPPSELPIDGSVGSFDTNSEDLYTTDEHLEAYLEVARKSVTKFIASRSLEPGKKIIQLPLSDEIKRGIYEFDASAVPPAGHLTINLPFRQRNPSKENSIYVGPVESSKEYKVRTEAKPISVDFFEAKPLVTWAVVESNIADVKAERGTSLSSFKLTEDTFVEAQDLVVRRPVILDPIVGVQTINPQPYDFFKPLLDKHGDNPPDSVAPAVMYQFGKLINRGIEPDKKFALMLNTVFQQGRDQGLNFWEAVVEPMAISMCSLEFLFHIEDHSAESGRTISGTELANRLSYFLWRSAPDKELLEAGLSGELLKDQVRAEQIYRMIKDIKTERFLRDFTNQWLELEKQNLVAVDLKLYNFRESHKDSLKEETIQFLGVLMRKNLPIKNMIDSDFIVVNNETAEHYGIPDIQGHEFRVIQKDETDNLRGGILTHAGILMQTGNGDRTSIVERGVFVLRKILGIEPPPPPPNVEMLPTDGNGFLKMTAAELVSQHANTTQCKSCHNKIDPVGIGLEEFDAVGIFRKKELRVNPNFEKLSNKQKKKKDSYTFSIPIEKDGQLPNGNKFQGTAGLKKSLLAHQDRLAKSFIEALLTYGNGRVAGVADQTIVEQIVGRAGAVDYPVTSIIVAVLQSDALLAK